MTVQRYNMGYVPLSTSLHLRVLSVTLVRLFFLLSASVHHKQGFFRMIEFVTCAILVRHSGMLNMSLSLAVYVTCATQVRYLKTETKSVTPA